MLLRNSFAFLGSHCDAKTVRFLGSNPLNPFLNLRMRNNGLDSIVLLGQFFDGKEFVKHVAAASTNLDGDLTVP